MSQRRFSQNGQQALVRAYQAAREMGHAVIEPEHLLLGVLGEESALLKEWNGLEKQAAAEVFRRLGKGGKTPSSVCRCWNPAALRGRVCEENCSPERVLAAPAGSSS